MKKTNHEVKCVCGKKLYTLVLDSRVTGRMLDRALKVRSLCDNCAVAPAVARAEKAKKAPPQKHVRMDKLKADRAKSEADRAKTEEDHAKSEKDKPAKPTEAPVVVETPPVVTPAVETPPAPVDEPKPTKPEKPAKEAK